MLLSVQYNLLYFVRSTQLASCGHCSGDYGVHRGSSVGDGSCRRERIAAVVLPAVNDHAPLPLEPKLLCCWEERPRCLPKYLPATRCAAIVQQQVLPHIYCTCLHTSSTVVQAVQ
jgi:hypothetical protein